MSFKFEAGIDLGGRSKQNARQIRFKSGELAVIKESYKGNEFAVYAEVAAFRLDRLFGFNRIPLTVLRVMDDKVYSIQSFVPNMRRLSIGDRAHIHLEPSVVFFDTLIGESDRHPGNILIGTDGHLVLIDHGHSFGYWDFDSYDHKAFPHVPAELSSKERARVAKITEKQIISALADLPFDEDRMSALLERFRSLMRKIGDQDCERNLGSI